MRGNLERAQAERLKDLQEAIEGWGLERYGVAWPGYRAQAQIDRLHTARRSDEIPMVDAATPLECAARDRAAQLLAAWRQAVASHRVPIAACAGDEHTSDALERKQFAARTRRAECNHR